MVRQTFGDFEIVAIDDGSTDSTPAILDSFAERDSRVRVIHTPNRGIISALNTGIDECRGELIARMDADDISHPQRLEKQVELMDGHSEVSVCSSLIRMFPRAHLLGGLVRYEEWLNSLVMHDEIERDVFIESPVAHPSVMLRREELVAIGGYAEHGWAEDYDLWLRYYVNGKRFAKVPSTLLFWRQSEGRLTFTDSRYSVENFLRAKAHYLARLVPSLPNDKPEAVIPPHSNGEGEAVIPPLSRRRLGGGPSARPIILWGAGQNGRRLCKHLLREGIDLEAVVDVDAAKIGHTMRGKPIVGVDYLRGRTDAFVISAVGSNMARRLIREKLQEFGFVETRDFVCAA